jgi:hypothetical protein
MNFNKVKFILTGKPATPEQAAKTFGLSKSDVKYIRKLVLEIIKAKK